LSYNWYVALEGLRRSPYGNNGWRPGARKIAEFYGCDPAELWPAVVLAVVNPEAVRQITEDEAVGLLPSQAIEVMHALPAKDLDEQVFIHEQVELVQEAIQSVLDAKEQDILLRHIGGLEGNGGTETLEEIGKDYDLSRERIRMTEATALGKVRAFICRKREMGWGTVSLEWEIDEP
jgi:hypothetical protein